MQWIYTMVIKPVFSHVSTVWWSKVRYSISMMKLSKLQRFSLSGYNTGNEDNPNSCNRGPPLYLMTKVQAGIYRLNEWRPKSTNLSYTKNLWIWSTNPSYRWGLSWCYWDMDTTSHSWSYSLTSVNNRTGSTQTTKGAWSGTQMGPKLIKTLVLGCTDGAWEGDTASVLGSTPWYSRLKYTPLRFV